MSKLKMFVNTFIGLVWTIFFLIGNLELTWMLLLPSIYGLIVTLLGDVPLFPKVYDNLIILSARIHVRFLSQPIQGNVLGFLLSLLAFFLFLFAFQQRQRKSLTTAKLYSWSRHPQYLGLIIFSFGLLIAQPTFMSILCWILLLLFYILKAKNEERMLMAKYSEKYNIYKKNVPMFMFFSPFKSIVWAFKKMVFAGVVITFFWINVTLTGFLFVREVVKLIRGETLTLESGPRIRIESENGALIWDPHNYNERKAWEIALKDSSVIAYQKKSQENYGGRGYTFIKKRAGNLFTLNFFPDVPACGYTGEVLEVTVDILNEKVVSVKRAQVSK